MVACRLNTEKVIAAQLYIKRAAEAAAASADGPPSHQVHIVSPRWLWASHFRWEHLPEDQFPLDRDYHVSTFDPDVDSYPGSYRIGRRIRHFPAFAQPAICRQPAQAVADGAAPATADGLSITTATTTTGSSTTISATVDLLTVRSAIASIRAEEEAEVRNRGSGKSRSHRPTRKRRRNLSEPLPPPVLVEDGDRLSGAAAANQQGKRAKRVCHRISDGDLLLKTLSQVSPYNKTPADGGISSDTENPASSEALVDDSRSPSISMDEEDDENENEDSTDSSKPGTDIVSPDAPTQESTVHLLSPAVQSLEAAKSAEATASQDEDVDVISDTGEDDLNSTTEETNVEEEGEGEEELDGVDGTARGTSLSRREEEEEDIEAEMKNYLPPPCPLDLAENPLLHMPPQASLLLPHTTCPFWGLRIACLQLSGWLESFAASQMLTEIEEAVLEEQEERASTIPREMEIYDDDDDSSVGSSSSSTSSSRTSLNGTCSEDSDDNDGEGHDGGEGYSDRGGHHSPREMDQEERWLQIRRQLLLRKRGPDRGELAEIEKKLERIRRGRQGSTESRLALHTHSNRRAHPDHSSSHHHHHHHHWTRRLRSTSGSSPGIHSDPELSANGWWGVGDQSASAAAADPVASALLDQRDWNTCPEGYDYEDAERARALLRPETRCTTASSGARNKRRGRKPSLVSAAACLEGVTGLFGETSGSSDDDDDDDDDDEKPTANATVSSSSSSSSSHDEDADENEDLSVVTLDALKEFM
ncbi:unnamed protein product [Schistocephalus solidus]|uniref:BRCT domain-containing protein n=1 Tax=Schistocephalus solidus TaxID=70667 RepID=A0A3P7CS96_SCHSO|nr:unnamed protein product [Schistocephalus solidus]